MAHTYHELKEMTVAQLRDIAKGIEHDAVKGATQMNKEHLLPALCKALGIDAAEHHTVTGIDKQAIKKSMRDLKAKRAAALESGDHDDLKSIRRQLHRLNHQIRSHMQ
jgi:hypothetical protein